MSKHSRKKARVRKNHRNRKPILQAMCQNCGGTYPATPEALLGAVAEALNACDSAAGTGVRLRHGIVMTARGYVLPLANGRWAARTKNYTEFTPAIPLQMLDREDD